MDSARGAEPADLHATALVVDLDGTLVSSDLLVVALRLLLRERPYLVVAFPSWLLGGRASFKRQVARRVQLDPRELSYRPEVIALVREARATGRRTILASANDRGFAQVVADHLQIFDEVVASDGRQNLKGVAKLVATRAALGSAPFDYVGDSAADLPMWRAAREALVVAGGRRLPARVRAERSLRALDAAPAPGLDERVDEGGRGSAARRDEAAEQELRDDEGPEPPILPAAVVPPRDG